ncbi:MAG: hypothetical protein KJ737_07385 [Proteobacteria bacterium]|nr:hypothetical protein [Pseudomonadota bacterium]
MNDQRNNGERQTVYDLSTFIVKDSIHGPKCPHLDYLKDLIEKKAGFDLVEWTRISDLSEKRRESGIYTSQSLLPKKEKEA